MSQPEWIELSAVDFITIDTIGPPGQRTFYLQVARDELLITVIIEKEQAAALAIATGSALDQLGTVIGMPILSEEHRALRRIAVDYGVRYKPSGAGGGDFGIGFSIDPDVAAEFKGRAEASGFRVLELGLDQSGLLRTSS